MKPKFSKEICKQCNVERWIWSEDDEIRWNEGRVYCAVTWSIVFFEKGIPEECPYHLEHAVIGNKK